MRTGLLSGKMGPAWDWRCEVASAGPVIPGSLTGSLTGTTDFHGGYVAVSEYPAPGAEPLVYQYPDRATALSRSILFHT